jgi:undecaprenyl-diphosphatase
MREADAFSRRLLVVAILATAIFLCLTFGVSQGLTDAFDRSMLLGLRSPTDVSDPLGPAWLESAIVSITALGSKTVLTSITWAAAGYFVFRRRFLSAVAFVIASSGGPTICNLVKDFIDRPRPDIALHLASVHTPGFPSGHATSAAAAYLALALLLSRDMEGRAAPYLLAAASFLVASIGLSRVYLGVHYPTDIAAGLALGTAWAALCVFTEGYLKPKFGGAPSY